MPVSLCSFGLAFLRRLTCFSRRTFFLPLPPRPASSWVQQQALSCPTVSWADGARDYIASAEKIAAENSGGESASASAGAGAGREAPAPGPFSWPPAASSAPAFGSAASFFPAIGNAATPFAFGAAAAPAGAGPAADADDDDDEPKRPPSPSLAESSTEDVLHTVGKVKLFFRLPDASGKVAWAERGLGKLTLRREKRGEGQADEEKPCRISIRTEAGKVLLFANLQPGAPRGGDSRV